MTILVNWPAAIVLTCGLTVLLGLTWLLRGDRAAVRMCGRVGTATLAIGLGEGNLAAIAGGVIILGVACWAFRSLREPGRRGNGGRGR
jgi:hypothetical protein